MAQRSTSAFCLLSVAALIALLLTGCSEPRDPFSAVPSRIDLLLGANAESPVVWTVYAVPGREPRSQTLDAVGTTLVDINGPGSARYLGSVGLQVADNAESHNWTLEELYALRDSLPFDSAIVPQVNFVFLNGQHWEGNRRILGLAIQETVVVFSDSLDFFITQAMGLGPPNLGAAELERTTTIHELGHVLGLVNFGIPMLTPRLPSMQDDPCQCHSSQTDSVMYYSLRTLNSVLEFTVKDGQQLPYAFNQADWRDLRSYQESLRPAGA